MGPRPDGRGKLSTWCLAPRPCFRVNGAAARRPRKAASSRGATECLERQWGRGQTAAESSGFLSRLKGESSVNGAAARRPRKGADRQRRSPCRTGVNGAAARRPRKVAGRRRIRARPSASMGRGQTAAESGSARMSPPCTAGVNGAAARRPRKACGPRHHGSRCGAASMGPRPDGRGKVAVARVLAGRHGVNGAAARRPRKARSSPVPPPPRASRQWGRGQTAAERATVSPIAAQVSKASMGPRPDGRGKAANYYKVYNNSLRQWGRGQTAAESAAASIGETECRLRQWGRGQTAAER